VNPDENPVAINVTALIDVILCLCLFFVCAPYLSATESFQMWLPLDR